MTCDAVIVRGITVSVGFHRGFDILLLTDIIKAKLQEIFNQLVEVLKQDKTDEVLVPVM